MGRLLIFLFCWSYVSGQDFPSLDTWSYQYQQYWKNIIGASCSSSSLQSPIDIPRKLDVVEKLNVTTLENNDGMSLGPLAWSLSHWTCNVSLQPGPVTWEVKPVNAESNSILVNFHGKTYSLEKMTFKSPSEHTVEGAHNAMEVQMHHVLKDQFFQGNKRLVVSVSLRESEEAFNTYLNPIFSQMPQDRTQAAYAVIGNPFVNLAPADKSFITYEGSTTMPPCYPATWVVFLEPQYIGVAQLEQFRSSISGYEPSRLAPANSSNPAGVSDVWDSRWGYNTRAVQALNARTVSLVQMADAKPEDDVPKLNYLGSGPADTWKVLVCIMLLALLATGCLLLLLKRIQNNQECRGYCDGNSSEEEDVREFQAYPQSQAAATLLSPLPDPYMHMAPARAGFAKHDQIYLG